MKKQLNELLNKSADLRSKIRELGEQTKVFNIDLNICQAAIIKELEEQGVDRVGNDVCTISIRKEIVPKVEDWDQVYDYLLRTKQFELLHRKMTATAYRELQTSGIEVPGVKPMELTRINFRSK